jgi:predicted alpha/beta-fold hydrolase
MAAPAYEPSRWLPHAHLQTVYASLLAHAPSVEYRRERWDTPDGDFVDVDFVDGPAEAASLHLFHGLEGSSRSHYARMLMHAVKERGWRGSVLNFRGCSGEPNRLPRAYHSGDSDEVDWVVRRLRERLGKPPLYAVGVSMGGNALLKWLGERGEEARRSVDRAAAVSAPMDLMAGGDALGRGFAILYARHFLATLKRKSRATIERFPGLFDDAAVQRARTLRDFDNAFTAPVHGFRDTDDYWTRSSAKPWLPAIRVPTLLVNARDDPFMPERALPTEREVSDAVTLEFPPRGGHVGFVSGAVPGDIAWLARRLLHFFEHHE